MPSYLLLVAVLLAMALGFIGGMTTYQRSRRWCPQCGVTLTCQTCQPAVPVKPRKAIR